MLTCNACDVFFRSSEKLSANSYFKRAPVQSYKRKHINKYKFKAMLGLFRYPRNHSYWWTSCAWLSNRSPSGNELEKPLIKYTICCHLVFCSNVLPACFLFKVKSASKLIYFEIIDITQVQEPGHEVAINGRPATVLPWEEYFEGDSKGSRN